MISLGCVALLAALAAAPQSGEAFEVARREYQDVVRTAAASDVLTAAAAEEARAVVLRLAATGEPQALEMLALDAGRASQRFLELAVERDGKQIQRDELAEARADKTGSERESLDAEIVSLEQRVKQLDALLPPFRTLREALYEGLLEALDRAPASDPERAYSMLVAWFKEDVRAIYRLEQAIRKSRAELEVLDDRADRADRAEPQDGAGDAEGAGGATARRKAERQASRLRAELEVQEPELERFLALKRRRLLALAGLYPDLSKGVQTRAVKDIQDQLRDETPWETRALHAELLGFLPVESAIPDLMLVMRRAAKARSDQDKQLEDLRTTYDRALKAVITSLKGGGGLVPAPVLQNKNQAERELRAASDRSFGEERVLEAAAKGLGAALAALAGKAREVRLDQVLKQAAQDPDGDVRARTVWALAAVDDPHVRAALRALAAAPKDVQVRLAALDALAGLGDEGTVELCVTTLLKDAEWRVRAAAMRYLVAVPRKSSVPALIESLGAEVGRLVDDAEVALQALTGRSFNADLALWKDWWQKNKETFEVGQAVAEESRPAARPAARQEGGHVSFYGIQTRSRRILFVLDRSGSMAEPAAASTATPDAKGKRASGVRRKIDAAKDQLKSALAALEEGDLFNVISYAEDVGAWQRKMVKMAAASRGKAEKHVDKEIVAVGGTNIHDALREAFRLAGIGAQDLAYESNVDTIFFLTDGQPSVGEVQDPEEILRRVREWNRLARIVIHTVGVGEGHDAAFLLRLATENGGQYTSR